MHSPESNHQQPKSLLTVKRKGHRPVRRDQLLQHLCSVLGRSSTSASHLRVGSLQHLLLRLQWKEVPSQKSGSASSTTRPTSSASFSSGMESSTTSSSAPTAGGETSTSSFSSGTESSTTASHSRVGAIAFLRSIIGSSRGKRSK